MAVRQNDSADRARLKRSDNAGQARLKQDGGADKTDIHTGDPDSEGENTLRKLVFAAAVGIQDATLSNLACPLLMEKW